MEESSVNTITESEYGVNPYAETAVRYIRASNNVAFVEPVTGCVYPSVIVEFTRPSPTKDIDSTTRMYCISEGIHAPITRARGAKALTLGWFWGGEGWCAMIMPGEIVASEDFRPVETFLLKGRDWVSMATGAAVGRFVKGDTGEDSDESMYGRMHSACKELPLKPAKKGDPGTRKK